MNELEIFKLAGSWGLGGIGIVMLFIVLLRIIKQNERHTSMYVTLTKDNQKIIAEFTKSLVNIYNRSEENIADTSRNNLICAKNRDDCNVIREALLANTTELNNIAETIKKAHD